ncbi:Predicted ester cyclase [Geodermatophilus telluris]|uniref:Predicted ester cyclase n=1 Tax=Geodermatophilus telluris TaxID=1190417 RepID=A0A1G6NT85_9ACTN|nr:nuclear transport factor 2 family protein [Geodermatophilus telluris]SDC71049.1 Predicted ester cyclase [Geodermatophilus telluris]
MTDDDTRTVMEAYLGALLGNADFERFLAPDVVWTTMETGQETHGRHAVRDLITSLHTQVFDARPELVSLVCGDGTATIEAVFDGRQTGEFAGVPARGAHVRIPYAVCYDVADGLITALRAYFPMAALRDRLAGGDRPVSAIPTT